MTTTKITMALAELVEKGSANDGAKKSTGAWSEPHRLDNEMAAFRPLAEHVVPLSPSG